MPGIFSSTFVTSFASNFICREKIAAEAFSLLIASTGMVNLVFDSSAKPCAVCGHAAKYDHSARILPGPQIRRHISLPVRLRQRPRLVRRKIIREICAVDFSPPFTNASGVGPLNRNCRCFVAWRSTASLANTPVGSATSHKLSFIATATERTSANCKSRRSATALGPTSMTCPTLSTTDCQPAPAKPLSQPSSCDGARALRTGIAAFYGNGAKWTTIPHDEE
jgi:hypothetical protein